MDFYDNNDEKKVYSANPNDQNFIGNLNDLGINFKDLFNLDTDQKFALQMLGIGLTLVGGVITIALVCDSYFDGFR